MQKWPSALATLTVRMFDDYLHHFLLLLKHTTENDKQKMPRNDW
jgi:hypothetical protein